MSDEEIEALKERVKQLESSQLRDQRSTALYAALGAALLLGGGVWIGHALHSDPAPAAQAPVVVTIPPQPAAPPAPASAVAPTPEPVASAPSAPASAPATAAPAITSASYNVTRPAVFPSSSAPHKNADRGF